MCQLYEIDEPILGRWSSRIAGLSAALEPHGAWSADGLARALLARWLAMPEDEAVDDAGALIQQVLDILDADVDLVEAPHATQLLAKLLAARLQAV